jgi:hypothetical protein
MPNDEQAKQDEYAKMQGRPGYRLELQANDQGMLEMRMIRTMTPNEAMALARALADGAKMAVSSQRIIVPKVINKPS